MATTAIVATAIEAKISLPVRNIPAIAVITTTPETSTERPDVAAAARLRLAHSGLRTPSRSRFK